MLLRLSSVRRSTIRARQHARARRSRRLWALEGLEGRVLLSGNPTYYTVNLTTDNGPTSAGSGSGTTGDLRYVINQADGDPNLAGSVIEFDPTVFATPQTITLSSTLGTLELSETAGPEMIDGPGGNLVTISGNNAVGVFHVDGGVTATLSGLTITGGSATNGGGINNAGTLTVTDSTIENCNASNNGGGIDSSSSLTVTDSTITGNQAGNNGGGIDDAGKLTLTDSVMKGDDAPNNGGDIYNSGSGALTGCSLQGACSTSGTNGKGGAIWDSGTISLRNSTIYGSNAIDSGGGIYVSSGTVTIANSTLSGNYDFGNGGAAIYMNSGTLITVNTTISKNVIDAYGGNDGGNGGGLYVGTEATATLDNTIVALNARSGGAENDIAGSVSTSSANNLIGTGGSGGLSTGVNGNLVGVANPGLGGLTNNGGPTRTIALLTGSPGIGAGRVELANAYSLTTDQRGEPRFVNGTVDIGAFERPSVVGSPTVYTVDSTGATGSGSGDTGDLIYVLNQANADPSLAGSVITFDPAIFNSSSPQTIDLPEGTGLSNPFGPEVIQGPGTNILTLTIGSSSYGGPIVSFSSPAATISGLTISGLGVTLSGPGFLGLAGGISNSQFAALTVNDCSIEDCFYSSGAGGILNDGWLMVENSTIADNGAASGGGISNGTAGTLTVVDSTIADNITGFSTPYQFSAIQSFGPNANGGGIDNFGSLTVVNTTIAHNQVIVSGEGDGLFDEAGSTVLLDNTIVALNTGPSGPDDIAGVAPSSSSGYNLIGVDETESLINGNNGNLVGVTSPGLAMGLANNGGPTQTIALLAGSPAVDGGSIALAVDPTTGSPLTTDQRGAGFPRTVNGTIDIGAFEQGTGAGGPTPYTVTNTSDAPNVAGSLPWAISQANASDNSDGTEITFNIPTTDPGYNATTNSWTITLSSTLKLSETIGSEAIDASGAAGTVIISGKNACGVFQVDSGITAALTGLTITDGFWTAATAAPSSSGGGGIDNFGTLAVTDCTIEDSSATDSAGDNGGGIDNEVAGAMAVDGSTVEGNSAGFGGGIFNAGAMSVTGSSIAGNSADNQGGGIGNNDLLSVSNCTITGNQAAGGGGMFNAGELELVSSTVADNQASNGGGIEDIGINGYRYLFSYLMVTNSTIADNRALGAGGGIDNLPHAGLWLIDCTITGDTAGESGGGEYNEGNSGIINSTISNNSASHGGGIYNGGTFYSPYSSMNGGVQSIGDCTITGNSASGSGGGIENTGLLMLGNSTLANNSASAGGGVDNIGILNTINTTIAYNRSTSPGSGGGICDGPNGVATLYYTIIALNTDNIGADDISGAGVVADFGNLIGTGGAGGLTNGSDGNQVGVANPGLAAGLANNGGPTQTIALLGGSPAIDIDAEVNNNSPYPFSSSWPFYVGGGYWEGIGLSESTDQRGAPRFVNGTVDIGAFEGQEENTTTTVAALPATSVSGQSVTFTATVATQAGSAIPIPTGSIQFEVDGSNFGSPVTLVNGSATSPAISSLSVASHTVSAVYTSNSADFLGSTGSSSVTVEPATASNIQSVINNAPSSSGGSVTLQTTSSSALSTALQAVSAANPSSPVTVTLDLGGAAASPTTAFAAPSNVQVDLISSSGNATVSNATVTSGTVVVAASVAPVNWIVNGGNVFVEGSAAAGDFVVNGGTVTLADGTVITGNSPAITLNGGTVILQGVTARTATSAPTILVNGGSLTVRNSTIEESTGYAEAAILITGGTVDLGTTASPGGNTFNVNGTGTLIQSSTASPVPAVGDTFENNGAAIASSFGVVSLSAPPSQTANQGVPQSFSLGSLTDTVTDSQSWAVDVNWGDNSAHTDFNAKSTGPLSAQPHAFATPGTYTVTVTVTDPIASGATAWDFVQSFTVTVAPSIFVLDPSAGGALSLSGNASLKIPGAVVVDSSSKTAVSASGNAQVKASVIDVHGGVQKSGNASFSPAPTTGAAALADPLAGLASPSTSGLTNYGSESLSGNSSATIKPGIYSQITVSGNAKLTLNSGLYIIEGGGFSVAGNASVTGSGVTIFNAGNKYPTTGGTYGSITLSGNGSYNLSPPTTGTYAGIVIFQSRDNTKSLTVSGNASGMTGTIYAPAAQLAESGNAQLNAAVVVDTLVVSGNGVANTVALNAPSGAVAYTPAQIRAAYGIAALGAGLPTPPPALGAGLPTPPPLDGTGQTIAIVDAYDDPAIFQALDAFDSQFGLTSSGPSLYAQYGPASSFLTVLNQYGQATSLPGTDPNGPGTDNWEVEEALDVEWAHAIAPGAQIILVEANSQSLADLMAGVATAASQPGVSVVSMSWGFAEGQAVFASDEAAYDRVLTKPGVTFVASTGDYGAADPEYPAYSPNVLAVGGTSLALNADNSYNSETGWGYDSNSVGTFIGSGGGISLYEPEPAYQQGVQSTGYRTTPDVSLVADPATGAWIADPYNLNPSDPFEIVGGTSLSAPAWAGLLALVNQGRADAGALGAGLRAPEGSPPLNSSSPTETQQALYMLPQSDYNVINSGTNGYSAGAGYKLVTGLGTPVANRLVPDLIAYQGPGTSYAGPTVAPLQNAGLVNTGTTDGGPMDVFSAFDSFTVASNGLGDAQGRVLSTDLSSPMNQTLAPTGAGRSPTSPPIAVGSTTLGPASSLSPAGLTPLPLAGVTITPVAAGLMAQQPAWSTAQAVVKASTSSEQVVVLRRTDHGNLPAPFSTRLQASQVPDSVLDELASDAVLVRSQQAAGTSGMPVLPWDGVITDEPMAVDPVPRGAGSQPVPKISTGKMPMPQSDSSRQSSGFAARLAVILLAAGPCGYASGILDPRNRRAGRVHLKRRILAYLPAARRR